MKLNKENSGVVAKAIASAIIGIVIWCGLKYAFNFTWFQSFMLAWLYCILRDSVIHSKE
jgi:hypothetical protein